MSFFSKSLLCSFVNTHNFSSKNYEQLLNDHAIRSKIMLSSRWLSTDCTLCLRMYCTRGRDATIDIGTWFSSELLSNIWMVNYVEIWSNYFNYITYRRGTAVPESVYITRIGNPIIIVKGASLFNAVLVVRAAYIILIYYSLTVSLITRESWQPCGGKVLLLPDMREIFI